MDILYLEGINANDSRGLIFLPSGDYCLVTPGEKGQSVAVSSTRKARQIIVDCIANGRQVRSLGCDDETSDDVIAPHLIAAKISKRDVENTSALRFLPVALGHKIFEERCKQARFTKQVQQSVDKTGAELVLTECELNGFRWDEQHVYPNFSFAHGKTQRFSDAPGAFRTMSIRKEDRHRLVPSRSDRSIVVFDFNAIDARSIISMHQSAVESFGDAEDVYTRMVRAIFGVEPDDDMRAAFKLQFFKIAYGAGEHDDAVAGKLRSAFPWLEELRLQFKTDDKHLGYGLAIAAQSTSSRAFWGALRSAAPFIVKGASPVYLMAPLFTVHDELVCEVDDTLDWTGSIDDRCRMLAVVLERGAQEASGVKHRVKWKIGKDYATCK